MKSWKTTIGGLGAILAAVGGAINALTDADPMTNPDWTAVLSAISAGVALLFARDNDKKSESVGAK